MDDKDGHFGERVAASYDVSSVDRFEPSVGEPAVDVLAVLAGCGRGLELGIGTGRLALPLAWHGISVHDIETSRAMVVRLRAKPGGDASSVTIGALLRLEAPSQGQLSVSIRDLPGSGPRWIAHAARSGPQPAGLPPGDSPRALPWAASSRK